ncbi:hypothetical protein ACIOUE_00915 [Streptomyces xanthochromogenes]|uniref:hypothetical protein n=1 Tax=Streptomyces xanthochromogenes TaxID=67384 RepID=UPI0037F2FFA8
MLIGALFGALATGLAQYAMHLVGRRERRREAVAAAVAGVLGTSRAHRGRQYLKHVARREGLPDTLEARETRYDAQSAMQDAMDAVITDVADAELRRLARDLVGASLALGDADPAALDTVGDRARDMTDALRAALARYLHQA